MFCGAETWEDIEDLGYAKFDWLSSILDMKIGMPSHDTFNRFFRALNPGEFETHFIRWAQSIISDHDYEFVSIDDNSKNILRKKIFVKYFFDIVLVNISS